MNIGLWNIDHPETAAASEKKERRFAGVCNYLIERDCDAYVIVEANSAIELPGYFCARSAPSPFKSSRRFYGPPNSYYQVAIYSKTAIESIEPAEPVNGLRCAYGALWPVKTLYGNVITIKDQWSKSSQKTYADRLDEQIEAIRTLPVSGTLVAGDFNLRLDWKQKKFAHRRIKEELAESGWIWPTEERIDTVQHVLHSKDLKVQLTADHSVKYDSEHEYGLSDHPFIRISVERMRAGRDDLAQRRGERGEN